MQIQFTPTSYNLILVSLMERRDRLANQVLIAPRDSLEHDLQIQELTILINKIEQVLELEEVIA